MKSTLLFKYFFSILFLAGGSQITICCTEFFLYFENKCGDTFKVWWEMWCGSCCKLCREYDSKRILKFSRHLYKQQCVTDSLNIVSALSECRSIPCDTVATLV